MPKNFDFALRDLEMSRSYNLEDIERQRVFESRRLRMLEGFERDDIWQLKHRAVVENERVLQTRQIEHEEAFRRKLQTLLKDLVYQIIGQATNKRNKNYTRMHWELKSDLFCTSCRPWGYEDRRLDRDCCVKFHFGYYREDSKSFCRLSEYEKMEMFDHLIK